MMDDWVQAVLDELDLTGDVDVDAILDVAGEVAHNVQRPAAPVTAYLLGLAVGRGAQFPAAAAAISARASDWS